MMYEDQSRFWYAVGTDGNLYCLGDCGDFDAADEIAKDTMPCGCVWILDRHFAEQWLETLNKESTK